MVVSLVSSSVSAAASLATYSVNTSHKKNETAADAIEIGNLNQESAIVSVSDEGAVASSSVSTTFTAQDGYTSLSETYGNVVDKITTVFQLLDNSSNIIASNALDATEQQKAAFTQWQAGSLALSAGTYTATATAGNGALLSINKSEQQGSALQVSSTLTGSDTSEYYKFSLSGSNIKLDFTQLTKGNAARVVLYNSKGAIVADSQGNAYQKAKYTELTSNKGLLASSGDYSIKVTYAKGANTTKDIKYDMQLYSGNSYAVVYKNKVKAQPYDNTAAGSVTATTDAQLYEHSDYNKISTSAAKAINVGWLQKDKSMLDISSMLTSADHTDYYSFILQQGDNLKFGFNAKTTKNIEGLRVQLMNSTGTFVIADNEGTTEQRAKYKELTTTNGMKSVPGGYVVKVTYATGAEKKDAAYELGIYSGTSYSAQYKTTASPQTYANAVLRGEIGGGFSKASAIAAYLKAVSNSTDTDDLTANSLSDALKSFI